LEVNFFDLEVYFPEFGSFKEITSGLATLAVAALPVRILDHSAMQAKGFYIEAYKDKKHYL